MSKARMQPSAKTGLVFKISVALFLLLAVVLYKLNDYFKQEKWLIAQNQLRSQIVSTKTAISSQLNQLKNVLSSYETELIESKINWVQLDPFFGIAKAQKSGSNLKIIQYIGRSGGVGGNWNAAYLEKALSLRKTKTESPISVQLFRDKLGGKFLAVNFAEAKNMNLIVVGSADYFQKYFDLNRGGKMTSLLKTMDNVLAAHSEADYVATLTDESALSAKKYLIEKEEIAGTNLIAMNYISKSGLVSGFVVPWSVVGLILGFGFIFVGLLYYGLDPIEKRIERYRKQERDQIFKETLEQNLLEQNLPEQNLIDTKPIGRTEPSVGLAAQKAVSNEVISFELDPVDTSVRFSSLLMPLQQALFNVEKVAKKFGVTIEKHINTTLSYDMPYAAFIRTFENILKSRIENVSAGENKKITVRAYDIEQNISVIEIKDFGDLVLRNAQAETALAQAHTLVREANAELKFDQIDPKGVLIKFIVKQMAFSQLEKPKIKVEEISNSEIEIEDAEQNTERIDLTTFEGVLMDDDGIDLEKALSLDDLEIEESPEIKTAMTSKIFKTTNESGPIHKPTFTLNKKDFKIDEIVINVRRPNTERIIKS